MAFPGAEYTLTYDVPMPIQMDEKTVQLGLRGAFFVALAQAAALLAGCSPPEPLPLNPGRSQRLAGGPTTAPTASAAPAMKWERWEEMSRWRVAVPRAPSQHLAADREAETLVNDAALAYPNIGPTQSVEPGAILMQRIFSPGGEIPELFFAMVRRAAPSSGDTSAASWDYVVITRDGLVAERGDVEVCARCHAEAPHNGLFGQAR